MILVRRSYNSRIDTNSQLSREDRDWSTWSEWVDGVMDKEGNYIPHTLEQAIECCSRMVADQPHQRFQVIEVELSNIKIATIKIPVVVE